MSMAERIRKRRQELGMSQEHLAAQSGVSRPTIARLESGSQTVLNTDTAKALARALGVSVDYLIGTWDDAGELESAALVGVEA
jgi:transcriptional regulator with XRE-family HTH domain